MYSEEKKPGAINTTKVPRQKEILAAIRKSDPEAYRAMLEQAKEDLKYFGERYPHIIEQGDAAALHELKHKHTTMINLFDAVELSRQFGEAIDLLNNNATDGRLDKLKGKTLKNLDSLKERIDNMIQEAGFAK